MHTGKELEAHCVEKGLLSCDSDAPQVGSARSDSTRAVKGNRRKTNRRKTRPYCTVSLDFFIQRPADDGWQLAAYSKDSCFEFRF